MMCTITTRQMTSFKLQPTPAKPTRDCLLTVITMILVTGLPWYCAGRLGPHYAGIMMLFSAVTTLLCCVLLPIILICGICKRGVAGKHRIFYGTLLVLLIVFAAVFNRWSQHRAAFENGFCHWARKKMNIAEIRSWMNAGSLSPDDAYVPCAEWPVALRKFMPMTMYLDTGEDRTRAILSFSRASFGLGVGPADSEVPPSTARTRVYALEPGAYVWSEL